MSELVSGTTELLPQAEQVGRHLLRQIETNNPLLSEPQDRFEVVAMVAQFTGSEKAIDLAWAVLREGPKPFRSTDYKYFVETLIKQHGALGAVEAKELTYYIPQDDGETKLAVLTMAAEAVDDEELRTSITGEALETLDRELAKGADSHSGFWNPANWLLRLGVANDSDELVDLAAQTLSLTDIANKFDFMEEVAKVLKNINDSSVRSSLVRAAVQAQGQGTALPATIVRHGFEDLLNTSEMQELLRAVHRDGKQPLYSRRDMIFNDPQDGISVSSGTELTKFNKLATEYGTWVSHREHARFALHALRARAKEVLRQEGRPRGGYSSAVYMAREITEALVANPSLPVDDILSHYYMFRDKTEEEPEGQLHGLWSFGVLPMVKHGHFQGAEAHDVGVIHDLRNRLPYLSAARISLNAALASSGDHFALVDSANALTRDPNGILTRPVKREDSATTERRLHLFPYKWDFFDLVYEK